MTAEKTPIENPFAVLYAKVENVERMLVILGSKLDEPRKVLVNPNERLTRRQVSQQYKVSLGTIHNLMKAGKLAYEKVGRKTLFRREDVERCFDNSKGGERC